MTKDYRDYLEDILAAIDDTEEFVSGFSLDSFLQDRKTSNAVIRSLEVLGEAAKRIPEEMRDKAPAIPWRQMAGMRDKLIHEYFGVDLNIVWAVIKNDLPPLRPTIKRLLEDIETP